MYIDGLAFVGAHFGSGSGPIVMDDVSCATTTSDQLLECSSAPLLTSDCTHAQDAGVGCDGKTILHCMVKINECTCLKSYSTMCKWGCSVGWSKCPKRGQSGSLYE